MARHNPAPVVELLALGHACEMARNEAGALQKVRAFLDLLVTSFADLGAVMDGELEPAHLRRDSMLGSATILRVLAATYHELLGALRTPVIQHR